MNLWPISARILLIGTHGTVRINAAEEELKALLGGTETIDITFSFEKQGVFNEHLRKHGKSTTYISDHNSSQLILPSLISQLNSYHQNMRTVRAG